ncbi:MAG TPA: ABC transporter substrate-binding protein [Desulfosporosinus sp.]|nr:ABC transporter substrate-binding protein [Desulfosporosinus sp.]
MKVTRSYWLGLGSGLILSAMLTLVISPQQGQAVIPQEPSSVPPVKQQATTQPLAQPSVSIQQNFIIPKGASSGRIADLLVAQGFIKDKESFLVVAHQMGVESQFRAGTFTLSLGLTSEELIHRLLK